MSHDIGASVFQELVKDLSDAPMIEPYNHRNVYHYLAANNMSDLISILWRTQRRDEDQEWPIFAKDSTGYNPMDHAPAFGHRDTFDILHEVYLAEGRGSWDSPTFEETPFAAALYSNRGRQLEGIRVDETGVHSFTGRVHILGRRADEACRNGLSPYSLAHVYQFADWYGELNTALIRQFATISYPGRYSLHDQRQKLDRLGLLSFGKCRYTRSKAAESIAQRFTDTEPDVLRSY